jgi:hemoglobin-like flavoprotein
VNSSDFIRSNFSLVVDRAPDVVERFYVRLFSDYPELKPLFGRRSQKAQAEMLTQALISVVDHLDDPKWLVSTLAPMGDTHRTYGVTDEMYPKVAAALVATLREVSHAEWNAPTEKAWSAALGQVAQIMIGGVAATKSEKRELISRSGEARGV